MDARLLLRRAVEGRIEAWDHPVIDERDEAAGEVDLMLQVRRTRFTGHSLVNVAIMRSRPDGAFRGLGLGSGSRGVRAASDQLDDDPPAVAIALVDAKARLGRRLPSRAWI